MKNLKRVLSLALATVMLLGIMVIGANATFADQADIKYTAAVDTMVQLGVLDPNGMGNNTFAPNGTLTRAQAAKMVAYVKAGGNTTMIGYYAGSTKSTDVTANHSWAEGSINYCVANSIINGMTETTYAPDASLTGSALAKMLLVALGYPTDSVKDTEALTGANWANNAITRALDNHLFDGLDSSFVATKAVTREEACQMIFNALSKNLKVVNQAIDGYYTYTTDTKTGYASIDDESPVAVLSSATEITSVQSGYFVASDAKYVGANTAYYQIDSVTGAVTQATGLPALSPAYTVKCVYENSTSSTVPATVVYFTVVG